MSNILNNSITYICAVLLLVNVVYAAPQDVAVPQQALSPQQAVVAPIDEVSFSIWEYQIAGNTVLQQKILERALTPYLGPNKSADIINQAADALEQLFRDNGYPAVFIDIPEQNVVAGVVRLEVNEGRISRLRVNGAEYFTLSGLVEKVPSLHSGQTIHLPSVQAEIQKLHSFSADLQAVPIMKAGAEPGSMEIELRVKDELPVHGSVEVNNHYSANTTKSRLEASVGYDNLWQKFHSVRLTAQTTPEKTEEVSVLVVNYIMPVNAAKDRLAMYAVRSNSNIAAVGGLSVLGNGNIYGMRYVMPFAAHAGLSQSATFGMDYKDVQDAVSIQNAAALETPISYVVASAAYSATSYDNEASTNYTLAANFGLRGPNQRSEFDNKRIFSKPDFFYLRGGIERTDWLFTDVKLASSINLQLTDTPLISNEQYTAGGYATVRGYLESQILGDNAIAGGFELYSPKLFYADGDSLQWRALGFVEGASVSTLRALPDQDVHAEIISTGLGLRVTKSKQLVIKIDWARPLRDAGDAGSGTLIRKGESRVVFSLAYAY